MNIDKAGGIDNLSGKFLKDGAELCNLSINYSLFPTDYQIAKLKALFKKDSTTLPNNYRPISLLSLISKITGKGIHDQTQAFLDENSIPYRFKSGFGKTESRLYI